MSRSLTEVQQALEAIDPVEFEHRRNFTDDPPPPYRSEESTRSPSPEPVHSVAPIHQERRRARPDQVFNQHQYEEEERLRNDYIMGKLGKDRLDIGLLAAKRVIDRWKVEGIWNNNWGTRPTAIDRWKDPEEVDPPPIALPQQTHNRLGGRVNQMRRPHSDTYAAADGQPHATAHRSRVAKAHKKPKGGRKKNAARASALENHLALSATVRQSTPSITAAPVHPPLRRSARISEKQARERAGVTGYKKPTELLSHSKVIKKRGRQRQ
jgi:hypothetical protein